MLANEFESILEDDGRSLERLDLEEDRCICLLLVCYIDPVSEASRNHT